MSKTTQNYRLYELLRGATGEVSKEQIAKTLDIKLVSVPVYIHELKRLYKAEIESVHAPATGARGGSKVTGYRLVSKSLNVPALRKGAAVPYTKKVSQPASEKLADGSVAVPDKDLDIAQISEREFDDVRSSLGIGFGNGGRGSDY